MKRFSFNKRLIVAPYQSEHQIKATQGSGFAMIQQKVSLKGLKLLVDVRFLDIPLSTRKYAVDGMSSEVQVPFFFPKGSTVYIKEELLYTQPWAKQLFEAEGIDGKFIIVDMAHVEYIDIPTQSDAALKIVDNEDTTNR